MCSINRKVYIAYDRCFVDLPRHIAMFEPTLMHLRVTMPQAPPISSGHIRSRPQSGDRVHVPPSFINSLPAVALRLSSQAPSSAALIDKSMTRASAWRPVAKCRKEFVRRVQRRRTQRYVEQGNSSRRTTRRRSRSNATTYRRRRRVKAPTA